MSFSGARVEFHENGITLSWPEAVILPPQATIAVKPDKSKRHEHEDDEDSDESVPAWRESGEEGHVKVQVPESLQGILSSVDETMRLSVEEQRAERLKQRFKTVWRSAVCVSESDVSSALAKAREAHNKIRQLRESDAKEEEGDVYDAVIERAPSGGGILDRLGDALPGLIPKVIGMVMGGDQGLPPQHPAEAYAKIRGIPASPMSQLPLAGMGFPIGMQGIPSGIGPDDFPSEPGPAVRAPKGYISNETGDFAAPVPRAPQSVDEVLRLSQSFGDHELGGPAPKAVREVARVRGQICAVCRRAAAIPGTPRCQACAAAHEEQLKRLKPQMLCCGCKAVPAFENSALCQACIMKLASQHTARQARPPQARIQQQPQTQAMMPQTPGPAPSAPPAVDETTG